jgi:transposase InsO family protein
MRFRFIQQHAKRFGVRAMCHLMGVSRSGYYAWRKRPPSKRAREDKVLLALIEAIYKANRSIYGYRKVYARLQTDIPCGRDRVARLMRENGLRGKQKRRRMVTTQSKHNLPIADNLLQRDFEATATNQKWCADLTYIWTAEGWLYLAAIEDLYSRFITGWALESSLTDLLTRKALDMALGRRRPSPGLIHHSDQGSQYASKAFRADLEQAGIVQSMSRRGNALDNAPIESFFSRLKNELIHHRHYRTRAEARRDIFEYIEVFYNRQRVHSALGYRSPIEFEALHVAP